VERLAQNHPLPDGNRRAAFLSLERFLAVNDHPILDADPDTDVPMMEKIAAGDATTVDVVRWLEDRTAHRAF
jgi:death-on-curing protein